MLSRLFSIRDKCRIYIQFRRPFYDSRTRYDTIFAPATSIDFTKGSPLGVIRISGHQTGQVLRQLTRHNVTRQDKSQNVKQSSGGKLIEARQATLTRIYRPDTEELIDKGLVLWFPKPNSYTGEDVCEFHLHGSQAIMKSMLDSLANLDGLRPAEPGEFTRRAFLNGKMSLLQAESLPDLIASKTDHQRRLALRGLDGGTVSKYDLWIKSLINILAHLEASIDFGEDELIGEQEVVGNCVIKLGQLSDEIKRFIEVSAHCREVIQTGVRAAILGKPNSGKSTFMNVLCRRNRSIVSDLSGTTRDVVEHAFELGRHAITLCDTAGLKDIGTANLTKSSSSKESEEKLLEKHETVEREGIRRALDAARDAHLIFYMIDGTNYSNSEEDKLKSFKELEDVLQVLDDDDGDVKANRILYLVINKMDLNNRITHDELKPWIEFKSVKNQKVIATFISCKSKWNLDKLMTELSTQLDEFAGADLKSTRDGILHEDVHHQQVGNCHHQQQQQHGQLLDYVNERHLSLLRSAHKHLHEASRLNLNTIDEMAQHVRESVDYLSRIVGSVTNDEVIDVIFRDFCIGK